MRKQSHFYAKQSDIGKIAVVIDNIFSTQKAIITLRYFISVVPRAEQSPGFALVIDRRSGSWTDIQVHILVVVVIC